MRNLIVGVLILTMLFLTVAGTCGSSDRIYELTGQLDALYHSRDCSIEKLDGAPAVVCGGLD